MTTRVTVDAHAGWPVKVVRVYQNGYWNNTKDEVIVPAYTTQDFYPHDGMHLEIYEEPEWTAGAGQITADSRAEALALSMHNATQSEEV